MDLLLSVFFGIQSLCNCVHKNLAPKLSQKVFIISRIAKTLWENTCIIHIFKCILSYIQKHMYSWTHLGNICSTNGNSTASWIHFISFSSKAIDHLNFFRLSSEPSYVGANLNFDGNGLVLNWNCDVIKILQQLRFSLVSSE